jgi:outer membrane protein OmpA-like peptidoglycan-associated protein
MRRRAAGRTLIMKVSRLVVVAVAVGAAVVTPRVTAAQNWVWGAATGAAIGGAVGGGKGAWKGAAIGGGLGLLNDAANAQRRSAHAAAPPSDHGRRSRAGDPGDGQASDLASVIDREDRLERSGDSLYCALSTDTMFESGTSVLRRTGEAKLADVARMLNRHPDSLIDIVGHTDNRDTAENNQRLSGLRAEAVRAELVRDHVDPDRLATFAEGEGQPVAANDTAPGRARNRRVTLVIRQASGSAQADEPR